MDRDDGGRLLDPDPDRSGRDPVRGCLHVFPVESYDEFVSDLAADVVERFELRLAFEAWADQR